jgi:hypothetical protein
MSGPITCGYLITHALLLLSARALREARAMKQEYGHVLAQLRDRELAVAQARQGQRAARLERIGAVRQEAQRQAARLDRLRSFAQSLATQMPDLAQKMAVPAPPAPTDDDDATWSAHLRALDTAVRELEALLGQAGGEFGAQVRASLAVRSTAPTIDEVLAGYVLQRQLKPGLNATQAERFRDTAARVLSRLKMTGAAALPPELEVLAKAIVLAPTIERAEALASELRLAVQRQRDAVHAQRAETEEARRLLEELPEDAPVPLLRALEHVAAGVERMDTALCEAAQQTLDSAAADREQREHDAAALVLQESLRDLGYEVDDIEATLFVDGGAVHFRRAGWDNYFVRLRLNPHERTVNFNVVRASGDEDTAERRRLDALAEDRWCSEFPRLLQTLAARGLDLDVTRRLEAGEVPVQIVDRASLPPIAAEDDSAGPRRAPRARDKP